VSEMIEWMAAVAEQADKSVSADIAASVKRSETSHATGNSPTHWFPGQKKAEAMAKEGDNSDALDNVRVAAAAQTVTSAEPQASDFFNVSEGNEDPYEEDRQRRIYRGRTITMLRRYMRYSIETGRLPSLLGREFFRAKVTSYTVVTFEDRVIFVHDMETSLNKLDEFSRQIIARHILQEHDQAETGRLLNCTERTIRTYVPMVLDLLSDILLEVGLLEPIKPGRKSCQGGKNDTIAVSGCEHGKNKF
jgi:hypothetical protein